MSPEDPQPPDETAAESAADATDAAPGGDRFARVVRTFVDEPMLWPVGLVVYLSLCSFGALILVYALRMRGIAASLALLLLIFMTVYRLDTDRKAGKLSPGGGLLIAFWAGSALEAFALGSIGAFQ